MISGHRPLVSWLALFRTAAAGAVVALAASPGHGQVVTTYPFYSAQSIVHAATQTAEALAPNAIATIYGTNLAFDTVAASSVGGMIPTELDGVSVIVNGTYANLFFVSPTQINFLVPYILTAGASTLVVTRQAAAGPTVHIQLNATAPGMFVYNGFAIATHLNGTLICAANPSTAGEIIVIYVDGLGRTAPDTVSGRIAPSAFPIVAASQLQVLLSGKPCPPGNVLYAGLAPDFAGLYQVNVIVPPLTPPNPEIRIAVGTQISPPAVLLALQ